MLTFLLSFFFFLEGTIFIWYECIPGLCLLNCTFITTSSMSVFVPLVAKLRSTSLQIMVTRSEGLKIIVSVISSLRGRADVGPASSPHLCTASTANSHYGANIKRVEEIKSRNWIVKENVTLTGVYNYTDRIECESLTRELSVLNMPSNTLPFFTFMSQVEP